MRVLGYEVLPAADVAQLQKEIAQARAARQDLEESREQAVARAIESATRAMSAEAMVRLQAKSIERLMASNDRMVGLVADMRRTGFGILEAFEVNDTPRTIDQEDAAAVEADRDLEADDDL